jgi:hypothetical protein
MTGSNPAGPAQREESSPGNDQDTDTGATEAETSRPKTTPDGKLHYSPDEAAEYGKDPESESVYHGDDGASSGDGS